MTKLISLLFTFAFCFTATGCEEDSTTTTQVQPEPEKRVVFDLPEGWEWMDKEHTSAILNNPAEENPAGFVKLDIDQAPEGTKEDAKAYIEENYSSEGCLEFENQCISQEFVTLTSNNMDVYAVMKPTEYWSEQAWMTIFAFEKNGRVFSMLLYDRIDLYPEVLDTITQSIELQ